MLSMWFLINIILWKSQQLKNNSKLTSTEQVKNKNNWVWCNLFPSRRNNVSEATKAHCLRHHLNSLFSSLCLFYSLKLATCLVCLIHNFCSLSAAVLLILVLSLSQTIIHRVCLLNHELWVIHCCFLLVLELSHLLNTEIQRDLVRIDSGESTGYKRSCPAVHSTRDWKAKVIKIKYKS